jgi:hypothetical protein
MKTTLPTLLIRIATLIFFVGMVGGLVVYRCKTAMPGKEWQPIEPPEAAKSEKGRQPIASSEGTSWLFDILSKLSDERISSSKIGTIFRPDQHDTLTAYEVMKMRQTLKVMTASESKLFQAQYQKAWAEKKRKGTIPWDLLELKSRGEYNFLSDSATAWLYYRYKPEQLSVGKDTISLRFQELLKKRQMVKKDDPIEWDYYGLTGYIPIFPDTVAVLRQMIAEKWLK